MSASWDDLKAQKTLADISFDVKSGSLCAIIGPVGSGKVCLVTCMLPSSIINGFVIEFLAAFIVGRVAYYERTL